ncbi:hypothetical protein GI582_24015 [Sulfitobacter sp. BDSS02]|nr:hypothetical protein [Sulfitobacter sp. BDSS02]
MSAESNPSDRKHGDSARPSESRPIERSGAAGAARLRDRIDRGAGGDKVAFQDPAAAPLGTDDEAAGNPPSAKQVSTAMQQEADRSASADRKPGPEDMQGRGSQRRAWWVLSGLLALAALMIAFIVA